MDYKIKINEFEGPMDLLLHLVKKADIDIIVINVEKIINQYLDFINQMKQMNLDIASEYLVMASELIEMKSLSLLPIEKNEEDDYVEDPREQLIKRLIEYQKYKKITPLFKDLEEERGKEFSKIMSDLTEFKKNNEVSLDDIELNDLLLAFQEFLKRKQLEKPLNTKITTKEYSVKKRNTEIKKILQEKKKVSFEELFDEYNKSYYIVTFLSILDLAKKQDIKIKQEDNFSKIFLSLKDSD